MSDTTEKAETTELYERRVTIMYTKSDVSMIDEWRAKERIWSRGDAIRRLVLLGLQFDSEQKKARETPQIECLEPPLTNRSSAA
jgi:hypothetical protein